ncbi:MAG TPA: glycine cleavage system protein GcvH [Syntrophomonadaceae bacterium]|nr:glycine cleavage system protein GcvH [Syntrophomonadaceae bacterium]
MDTLPTNIPDNLLYDKGNYWVKIEGDEATIGLTDYGQSTIGDILYIELEELGIPVVTKGELGSIEAGKWVGKIYSPIDVTTIEENKEVLLKPRIVNQDPYEKGWLLRLKVENINQVETLMNSAEYITWVEEQMEKERQETCIYE